MNFETFLLNESCDHKGRMLSDIYKFSDNEIEATHDFIQLIFPLDKPSQAIYHNIYLKDQNEIIKIKRDQLIIENIIKSKDWFIKFL